MSAFVGLAFAVTCETFPWSFAGCSSGIETMNFINTKRNGVTRRIKRPLFLFVNLNQFLGGRSVVNKYALGGVLTPHFVIVVVGSQLQHHKRLPWHKEIVNLTFALC
jgi:hypothetical protein